ncbi:MAG: response regulator [Thermoanaerobaculia bacterium]|nr:response regulator [Thermoanaerobaculia bacterium]
MSRESRARSLQQLLLLGTIAFAFAAGALILGTLVLFESMRRDVEEVTRLRLAEQNAADEITTAVYGQLLAAYQQLHAPGTRNRDRFDALGQKAYTRLRQYLFQPMTLEARLQVETLKEQHQALEVVAHGAFDLIARGESGAAQARVAEMHRLSERLQVEMARFVTVRKGDLQLLHEDQVKRFRRILLGITLMGAALTGLAIAFLWFLQRSVVLPLGHLAATAVKLGSGDLSARIPAQAHSELAAVARRFNEMATSIQSARAKIETQNLELNDNLRDLKQAQQALVQQEKLSAIGFMLAGLAHELNNPLAGILGSAECIAEELAKHTDPAVRRVNRELVTPLIRETARAGDLVRNLLHFSRQSSAQPAAADLRVAMDVAAGLRAYAFAQAGKELAMQIPDALFVTADAQRLEHAALNIMTNALEAMSTAGGTRLLVRAAAIGTDWVELTFEDDGPGFAEPDRAFDAFYSTKPVGSGTGLGLALAQRFITETGGSITAENRPSGGGRVTLRLLAATAPLTVPGVSEVSAGTAATANPGQAPDVPPDLAAEGTPALADPSAGARAGEERVVLVVEDEPALRNIQRHFLARIGIRTLLAKDAAEAVAILTSQRCDAVVTDIRMPGEMDGIALHAWIERHLPELAPRCLFVSGELAASSDPRELGVPNERVLAKPFTRDAYIARVLAVLEGAPVTS